MDELETGWKDQPFSGSRQTSGDEIKHLAKVRVGGSNPVFRSLNGVF